jgi:hypothetical protein
MLTHVNPPRYIFPYEGYYYILCNFLLGVIIHPSDYQILIDEKTNEKYVLVTRPDKYRLTSERSRADSVDINLFLLALHQLVFGTVSENLKSSKNEEEIGIIKPFVFFFFFF